MTEPAYTFEHAGLTVELHHDDEPRSRADLGDHLGIIVARDYGDEPFPSHFEDYYADVAEYVRELRRDGCTVIPARESDYGSSGARIHETDVEAANALIYVTAERLCAEYGGTGPQARAHAREVLRGELVEWDNVLQGNVFGYMVKDAAGEHLDSCWGYVGDAYPDDAYIRSEARDAAEHCAEEIAREAQERAHWNARDVLTVAS